MYEFNNPIHWDLMLRRSYEAQPIPVPEGANYSDYRAIPNISLVADSYILMIGTNCNHANPWWKWGGNATMRLLTLPSTTSDYVAAVQAHQEKLRLFSLTLIRFPDLGTPTYLLDIEVPYWFKQYSIEIWKYSGPTDDTTVEINLSG